MTTKQTPLPQNRFEEFLRSDLLPRLVALKEHIVGAAAEYPNSLHEKFDSLAANSPFIDWRQIVLCGDKPIIRAEYMIDDNTTCADLKARRSTSTHRTIARCWVHRVRNWHEGAVLLPRPGRALL